MSKVSLKLFCATTVAGACMLSSCADLQAELQQQMPILKLLEAPSQPPRMTISPVILSETPRYHPIASCKYDVRMTKQGEGTENTNMKLNIVPSRGRLFVTADTTYGISTSIISSIGQKYSFNISDAYGRHTSSESYRKLNSGSTEINNMDFTIPEYVPGPKMLGEVISWSRDRQGVAQLAFVYKGIGMFNGHEVIVASLIVTPNGSQPRSSQAVGFSLIDRANALPVLFSIKGNLSIELKLTGCD